MTCRKDVISTFVFMILKPVVPDVQNTTIGANVEKHRS
jgi:hypothetical protein